MGCLISWRSFRLLLEEHFSFLSVLKWRFEETSKAPPTAFAKITMQQISVVTPAGDGPSGGRTPVPGFGCLEQLRIEPLLLTSRCLLDVSLETGLSESSSKKTWRQIQDMLEETRNARPFIILENVFMGKSKSLGHDEVDAQIGDLLISSLLHIAELWEDLWRLRV